MQRRRLIDSRVFGCLTVLFFILCALPGYGVEMVNDPKGFLNFAWGSPLAGRSDLVIARAGPHINEYKLRNGEPTFADLRVDSVLLSTVDEQFARVTIRYRGEQTHKQVLSYLERTFGRVERLPGQMMRGLNQQYNWRGSDTEINLTYEANLDRGFVFIESRTLSPRFNDQLTDSAE
jgi:hypothetical protein